MKTSDSIKNIAAALLAAQQEIKHPKVNAKAKFGAFADLLATIDTVRAVFNKHGMTFTQATGGRVLESGQQVASTTTTIIHAESGEWISETTEEIVVPSNHNSISQLMGCSFTYHKRQQLCGFAGIRGDADDDGDAGIPSNGKAKPPNIAQDLDL